MRLGLGLGLPRVPVLARRGGAGDPNLAVLLSFDPVILFLMDEGSGTTLTNLGSAGSAANGTFASGDFAPTWSAGPCLTFDGDPQGAGSSDGEHVDVPAFGTWAGCDLVFRPHGNIDETTGSGGAGSVATSCPIGFAGGAGLFFGVATGALTNEYVTLQQTVTGGYSAEHRRGATTTTAQIDANSWNLLQFDSRAATEYYNIVLNGTEIDNATANTPQTPWRNSAMVIGARGDNDELGFDGDMALLVLYASSRTNEEQAACRTAIAALMADRSITLP